MNLSEAIRKRNELAEKLRKVDTWYMDGLRDNSFPCAEVKEVILKLIGDIDKEYEELFIKIEKAIEGMEIE